MRLELTRAGAVDWDGGRWEFSMFVGVIPGMDFHA